MTLLLYTAIDKLLHNERFQYALNTAQWLKQYREWLAVIIPVTELVLVFLMSRSSTRTIGLLLTACLMAAFAVYVAAMLRWSSYLPCGCGGIIDSLSWKQHLWLNSGLTLSALWAWYANKRLNALADHPAGARAGTKPAGDAENLVRE
jgi:hypothetical protein